MHYFIKLNINIKLPFSFSTSGMSVCDDHIHTDMNYFINVLQIYLKPNNYCSLIIFWTCLFLTWSDDQISNLFCDLAFSCSSITVYISPYFNSSWLWSGIIICGQGCRFLLGDVASCGHQSNHRQPCLYGLGIPLGRGRIGVLVWQSNISWHGTRTVWSRAQEPQAFYR